MKYLILLCLLISQTVWAECEVRLASRNATQMQVGPVENLIKTETDQSCSVKFHIKVNGKDHELNGEWAGFKVGDNLCRFAVEETRKNFLTQMAGTFKNEAVTVCNEGKPLSEKIKIGDVILETEVATSPVKKYFMYNGVKCRMFQEYKTVKNQPRTYNGVICQNEGSDTNWLVVDKW